MLYLTCTTITSVDIAHYGVSCAKDWVSVDCDTSTFNPFLTSRPLFPYHFDECISSLRGPVDVFIFFSILH